MASAKGNMHRDSLADMLNYSLCTLADKGFYGYITNTQFHFIVYLDLSLQPTGVVLSKMTDLRNGKGNIGK